MLGGYIIDRRLGRYIVDDTYDGAAIEEVGAMLIFMCADVQNILCFHVAMLNAHNMAMVWEECGLLNLVPYLQYFFHFSR